jgi:hypothetical protein
VCSLPHVPRRRHRFLHRRRRRPPHQHQHQRRVPLSQHHPQLFSPVSLFPCTHFILEPLLQPRPCRSPRNASGAVIVTAEFSLPLPVDIEVISSSIGPLDTQLLSQGINDLIKYILLPWLNMKGQHEGFPVSVLPALQLNNTSLTAGDSHVAISSNLQLK